ncbi:MAG: M23 family metallopeptidase [Acidobacteriota bacterium]
MAKKFYTIMIIPHAKAQLKKLHFSKNFLITIAIILFLMLISSLFLPHFLLKSREMIWRLSQLEKENRTLKEENKKIEDSIASLRKLLTEYEEKTVKFAAMVGISEQIPTSRIGAGGGSIASMVQPTIKSNLLKEEVYALQNRSDSLNRSFSMIENKYLAMVKKFDHIPSIMPVQGIIGYNYGMRKDPFTGKMEFHSGIDIAAPTGTIIKAPADGVVTRAGRVAGYGKTIILSHGDEILTLYGHLENYKVRSGDRLKRGDIIGYVGSTGRATGPHLHYEIIVHGKHANPLDYILD